jgi:uncharacterized protein (TIRG00374 family)
MMKLMRETVIDTSEAPPPRARRFRHLITLLLGLVIFAGVIALGGDNSLRQLSHVRPLWLIAAGGGVGLMLGLFSWRWRVIAEALAGRPLGSPTSFFFYSVTASATSLFMPQTANLLVVRTAMLNSFTGLPLTSAGASVLLDKLFDLLPVAILAPPALALIVSDLPLNTMLIAVLIEIAAAALLIRRYHALYPKVITILLHVTAHVARRVPVLKRVKALDRLETVPEADQLQGRTIQAAALLTLIGTLAMLLRSWLIAQTVGLDISPAQLVAGMALAQASLIVAMTPGALGTLELGWYVGLSAAGVPDERIAPFLIAHRVLQSAFVLLYYALSYLLHLATRHHVT